MNLLVSPIRATLNDAIVDTLMDTFIDGSTNFSDNELEQMVDVFRDSNDKRTVLRRLFCIVVFISFSATFIYF